MIHDIIDYGSIGQRLRAYRIAASLKAEQVAECIGISRAAVYRLEKGEIVKIETLEKLANLLDTSLPSLLGINTEYYSTADGFFERMRQLEETSSHIYSHFDPFSYLLTSTDYDGYLTQMLTESEPRNEAFTTLSSKSIDTLAILTERKKNIALYSPKLFNLMGIQQIERFLHLGLIGSLNLPPSTKMERILQARKELVYIIDFLENNQDRVEVAISQETIPSLTFQIFYDNNKPLSLAVSPFRLGELPNISSGIASVTSSREAISRYQQLFDNLWNNALKGNDAIDLLKKTVERY